LKPYSRQEVIPLLGTTFGFVFEPYPSETQTSFGKALCGGLARQNVLHPFKRATLGNGAYKFPISKKEVLKGYKAIGGVDPYTIAIPITVSAFLPSCQRFHQHRYRSGTDTQLMRHKQEPSEIAFNFIPRTACPNSRNVHQGLHNPSNVVPMPMFPDPLLDLQPSGNHTDFCKNDNTFPNDEWIDSSASLFGTVVLADSKYQRPSPDLTYPTDEAEANSAEQEKVNAVPRQEQQVETLNNKDVETVKIIKEQADEARVKVKALDAAEILKKQNKAAESQKQIGNRS
jgi:hypothetical protein